MTFGTSSLTLAALDQVAALRSTEFQGDDSAVMRLLHQYGADSDLANLLWDDLSLDVRNERREDISDLLALWVWRTTDNGSRIETTKAIWLSECIDENKVWVALHREGVPFSTEPELVGRAAAAFPSLAGIFHEALRNR